MAKSIQVQILSVSDFDKAIVRITKQSHFGQNFGNDPADRRKFRTPTSKVVLCSNRFPARDADKSIPAKYDLWVRGVDTSKQDQSFVIPTSMVRELIKAVEAYNAWGATQSDNPYVQIIG